MSRAWNGSSSIKIFASGLLRTASNERRRDSPPESDPALRSESAGRIGSATWLSRAFSCTVACVKSVPAARLRRKPLRARFQTGSAVTSSPCNSTLPAAAGTSPATDSSKVDLPQPFGASRMAMSPSLSVKEIGSAMTGRAPRLTL